MLSICFNVRSIILLKFLLYFIFFFSVIFIPFKCSTLNFHYASIFLICIVLSVCLEKKSFKFGIVEKFINANHITMLSNMGECQNVYVPDNLCMKALF